MKHLAPAYIYTPQGLQSNMIISIADDGRINTIMPRGETSEGVHLLHHRRRRAIYSAFGCLYSPRHSPPAGLRECSQPCLPACSTWPHPSSSLRAGHLLDLEALHVC